MPTIVSHMAAPLAMGLGLGSQIIPRPLLAAGIAASVIPDLDVLAFRLGIAYSHAAGHRGFSHSIAFALLCGLLTLLFARQLRSSRWISFAFVTLAMLSHGLLDMLTNGGLGIALFWPLSDERFFFPTQLIEVSPLRVSRVFSEAGFRVLLSELFWVWVPALMVFCALRWRMRQSTLS